MKHLKDDRKLQAAFLFPFICSLIAHGYSRFSLLLTHDSAHIYLDADEAVFQLSIGRFLQPVWRKIRGLPAGAHSVRRKFRLPSGSGGICIT